MRSCCRFVSGVGGVTGLTGLTGHALGGSFRRNFVSGFSTMSQWRLRSLQRVMYEIIETYIVVAGVDFIRCLSDRFVCSGVRALPSESSVMAWITLGLFFVPYVDCGDR